MKRKLLLLTMAICLVGLFSGMAQADELKIGFMAALTGPEATMGKDMENAAILAAEEINAKGGILGKKVKVYSGDAACDPQQATSAANKLVSEGVVAVCGGYCSGATLPTLKIYGDANVPIVIPAANSTKLIGANRNAGFKAYMINSTGDYQGDTAVALFKKNMVKKLAVIHQGDGYSADLAAITEEKWKGDGGEIVAVEVVNKGEQDHSSLITRLKSKAPDAVFWTAYYADGALLIKQLRQFGYKGVIAVGDGSNDVKLLEIAGKAAEGVFCTSNPLVDYLPEAKAFIDAYKKKFNRNPGPYSGLTYDGMNLLADAIKRAGSTDAAAIIKALKETKDFQGISGPVNFTDKNTLARSNFVVLVAKGGAWQLYE